MSVSVRLDRLPARPLAVIRRKVAQADLSRVVPEACGIVWGVVRSQQFTGAGRHVAVYLDGVMNVEVGVELDGPFSGFGEVVPSATPAGPVATATHLGPYQRLHETHEAILNWCAANGFSLAGPSWEIYGHWQQEWNTDPAKIVTDVVYLLTDNPSPVASEEG